MNKKTVMLLGILFSFSAFFCTAKEYQVNYSALYPRLDGKIHGDPAWKNVKWETNFLLHRKKAAPKYGSRFKALYTKDALYVAVECFEENVDKLKKVYNFNEFWIYDTVELFLRPANGEIMQFVCNYQSMTYESIPGSVSKRTSFRTGWKAVGVKGKKCWSTEFCIPLFLLGKSPASSNIVIRGNICRNSTSTKERSTWNLQMKGFNDPAGFGSFVLKKAPASVKEELANALKVPHWISLVARWKEVRNDPLWADIIARFPKEKALLEKWYADEKNYEKNSIVFYKTLSKIEAQAAEENAREKKRIWKRLFDE